MSSKAKDRIALISVSGDPACEIGQEEAGGQNVYVRQVGLALAQQGWQVDMFARRIHSEQAAIVEHTPNCRTIRLTAGPTEFIGRDHVFEYLPEFVSQFQAFQQQQQVSNYSLIHTNYWLSSWVGMELRKRFATLLQVHTYHSLGAVKYATQSEIPPIAFQRLAIEKACLETVDRVVATSPQEEGHMRALVSNFGQIDVIPWGTDIDKFGSIERGAARQHLELPVDAKIVLYVGRFDPRKGIETLVRAVAKSKFSQESNFYLIIAGGSRPGMSDGIERERIESIVDQLGLKSSTIFPGRLNDEILCIYYAAADVCVVPSHYEPFGLVAIEAMASRTPVVASNVGGLQFTVVPEITGLLARPQDEEQFATCIDTILSDPALRDEMGKAGRQRVEMTFSWFGVALQLSQLYNNLLNPVKSAPKDKSNIAA
jgi:glycosyltransferase involved in cell wall biosynthesis